MTADGERLWYVAYGSNMDRARLQRYLNASGDPTAPADSIAVTLPHRLFFAHESRRWTGGTAFIDPSPGSSAMSFGRAWLISHAQFRSVIAQENGLATLDVPDDVFALSVGEHRIVDDRRYGLALAVASPDGRPALTFTTPGRPLPDPTSPVSAYVRVLHRGLIESHGVTDLAAWNYIRRCGGQPFDA